MQEMVTVLSAVQYFDKYGVNGIGKGMDRMLVRQQILDSFRREIFGLVAMRTKKNLSDIPEERDPEVLRIARNVVRDEVKKYKSLIKMFEKYKETSGLLHADDLNIEVSGNAKDDEDIPEDAVMTDEGTMRPLA